MVDSRDISTLHERLSASLVKYKALEMMRSQVESSLDYERNRLECNKNAQNLLDQTKPYIDDVVSKFSESALKKLESLLCLAVRSIFTDREYSVQIVMTEKRGSKCAELYLIEGGTKVPLNDSYVGGGVLVALGFVIQCFYVVNLDLNRVLFLDESLTFISTEYLQSFMTFMKEMTEKLEITVVMITHDVRFHPYADRIYRVSNGKYSLEE